MNDVEIFTDVFRKLTMATELTREARAIQIVSELRRRGFALAALQGNSTDPRPKPWDEPQPVAPVPQRPPPMED